MGLPLAHNAAPTQFYLLHSASQIGSELSDQRKKWVKGAKLSCARYGVHDLQLQWTNSF